MNKPGKSMSPVVNKEPIKSYEEPILPFDEEKMNEQKCDYENLKHKSDKQTFSSILDVKNDMSDLGVLEKDGNTIHSQRRYKKKFALTSDKVHSGH
ncbi:uncharacterized protein MJAP1_003512 [Malassezia japonica]|uniref:Uncharacterized protein n=1 Tax=Malassezia japonica TaxID=223818 RepID=A0AAF0F675_9BASI|nr:uncharacterized protein MJAP1_003512 [Malassezia japonica]WFD40526.1 hypothetical protein MJAP1_003512 [Malassezia japonica]